MRRGSGRGAVGDGAATTTCGVRACLTGGFTAGVAAGLAGTCGCRVSSSSSFFLARIAFSTSPGLEICERSIFGVIACGARDDVVPACANECEACAKCTRTFSASSSSSELECVLPAPRPSSVNTSRTCLLLTSNSRARSLIRTLLIRLFSKILFPMHLVAHGYLVTMAVQKTCVNVCLHREFMVPRLPTLHRSCQFHSFQLLAWIPRPDQLLQRSHLFVFRPQPQLLHLQLYPRALPLFLLHLLRQRIVQKMP
jgi:hypothetical protein